MDKKISELDQALQINNDAVFPMSQNNSGTDTTYKASITQIGAEIAEDQTYSNLLTTDKRLVGAINEVVQGGGGGGSSTLAGLSDVDIDDQTLSDGQVLKYDSVEEKWVNDDVGAGGHTIVADDGTDLAQRANLQFIGAYSEDNSVDDTTEINVVRNMTRAQFNQLSADEKTGLINITDESLSAAELPIESGSATNTKDYIDTGLSGKADTGDLPFVKYEELNVALDNSGEGTLFTTNKYVVGIKDIPSDSLYVGYIVYFAGTLTKCKAFSRSALAFTSQGIVSMTRKIGVYYLDNIASQ